MIGEKSARRFSFASLRHWRGLEYYDDDGRKSGWIRRRCGRGDGDGK